MMGQHGGGLFLVAYLIIAITFGVPAMMAEWALARETRRGPLGALERAGLPGGRWASYSLLFTVLMASTYYGVIVGWVLYYAVSFSQVAVHLKTVEAIASPASSFGVQAIYLVMTVATCGLALLYGVRQGIERISRWGLPIFFILMVILMVRVLSLDGAGEGLRILFVPRWEDFSAMTPMATLGQVFFSFGLGGTFMLVYGSYMRDEEDIPRTALLTAGADIAAALAAGMIIIPAAVIYHLPSSSGPTLMFEVMPEVFNRMPGGAWFGVAFFGSVFLVALLSEMAAFEVVISGCVDGLKWTRRRSVFLVCITSCILAIPAMLFGRYIEISDLIWGSTMQPVGALFAVLAFAWCLNRGKALSQLRSNTRLPVPTWLFYWIKFGLPVGIVSTLVFSWINR